MLGVHDELSGGLGVVGDHSPSHLDQRRGLRGEVAQRLIRVRVRPRAVGRAGRSGHHLVRVGRGMPHGLGEQPGRDRDDVRRGEGGRSGGVGGGRAATLTLGGGEDTGYEDPVVIKLQDDDLNIDSNSRDKVSVQVRTRSGKTVASYTLTETGTGNGEFLGIFQISDMPYTSKTIRFADTDVITVTYPDKKISATATFTKE